MDPRLAPAARVRDIAPFHVMEVQTAARALEAAGRSVVHMEIGEPDFPTPPAVLDAARDALAGGGIYYTSALGLPALREAIARHYGERYGVDVDPGRIVVTAGSSGALLLAMALLVNRDEQILLADPGYPCNRHFVRVLEGEPVGIPVGPGQSYQLAADLVDAHWTARTRGVLIASPSNPTGTTVSPAAMRDIARVVDDRGGRLIVDEIYLGLSYEGEPRSALALGDELFVVSSFSKYFNMTGWRLGWIVAPPRHVRDLEKLAQNLYIAPSTVAQHAALACFRPETLALLEARRQAFRERRDFLVPALRSLGFGVPVMPGGGFFVYADCSRFSRDSLAFCRDVLEATGVAFTPGVDFGTHRGNEHVRFAYTVALDKLRDGVERLARALPARGGPPAR
ncbi:MAG: aminotransferase [Betaproteobacteria bacterium]|nr:MAG: aminotransferase [Betaproteobacteria bacterium]